MKKIWKEFREFAVKGNAIDLAVGVIIGAKEPVSKECPACAMTIPIKARRCPHCTTEFAGQTPG